MFKYLVVVLVALVGIFILLHPKRILRPFNLFKPSPNNSAIPSVKTPSSGIAIGIYQPQQDTSGRNIDLYIKEYYIKSNIPARPLPQGKLNYGGYLLSAAEHQAFPIHKHFLDTVYLPSGRAIGMCWEKIA